MPVPGFVLLGFMDEAYALLYLRENTVQGNDSDAALSASWRAAVARRGNPLANAGVPEIRDLASKHKPYLNKIPNNPRFTETIAGMSAWKFADVEIDPLLAFQVDVWTERVDHLCHGLSTPPTVGEMLRVCLPTTVEIPPRPIITPGANAFLLETENLNYRFLEGKYIEKATVPGKGPVDIAGLFAGIGSPLLQVVRYQNRCYLKNGYHRVRGLRRAGATHVPCLLLDADDPSLIGMDKPGFFAMPILQSADPPTCAHFAPDRAESVMFRRKKRLIHVSWSEFVLNID